MVAKQQKDSSLHRDYVEIGRSPFDNAPVLWTGLGMKNLRSEDRSQMSVIQDARCDLIAFGTFYR